MSFFSIMLLKIITYYYLFIIIISVILSSKFVKKFLTRQYLGLYCILLYLNIYIIMASWSPHQLEALTVHGTQERESSIERTKKDHLAHQLIRSNMSREKVNYSSNNSIPPTQAISTHTRSFTHTSIETHCYPPCVLECA